MKLSLRKNTPLSAGSRWASSLAKNAPCGVSSSSLSHRSLRVFPTLMYGVLTKMGSRYPNNVRDKQTYMRQNCNNAMLGTITIYLGCLRWLLWEMQMVLDGTNDSGSPTSLKTRQEDNPVAFKAAEMRKMNCNSSWHHGKQRSAVENSLEHMLQ